MGLGCGNDWGVFLFWDKVLRVGGVVNIFVSMFFMTIASVFLNFAGWIIVRV